MSSVILAFDAACRLAVRQAGDSLALAFVGSELEEARQRLAAAFPRFTPLLERVSFEQAESVHRGWLTQVEGASADREVRFFTLEELAQTPLPLAPALAAALRALEPHLPMLPYLHLGENDYIYKFRPEKERNRGIYAQDDAARALYQSRLCAAIKALTRTNERVAGAPAWLDFGAVRYALPSHFGFCLGVKNAIERAYEVLAENPGRRVFMLSELIHNNFVNDDLRRRGLRFLQTDKGRPLTASGRVAAEPAESEPLLWDTLTAEDVVVIPAFGATDEDKRRLVRKGLRVAPYDATCMLVEKVWKTARTLGRQGYTLVIHGKSEHEETKATFSNARRYAPAVIVRNREEARRLGEIVAETDPAKRARFHESFRGLHTEGFDVARHLERLAVINQTTLLSNETLEIIDYFESVYRARYGEAEARERVGGTGRRDTLCYATQVNQDALGRALADESLDLAFVLGGNNSSNTYQLYRLCEERLGTRAFFIQSEADILSATRVRHTVFPAKSASHSPAHEERALELKPAGDRPLHVLLTGGASCPDGIVQQVISRINTFFPAVALRTVEQVLAELERERDA